MNTNAKANGWNALENVKTLLSGEVHTHGHIVFGEVGNYTAQFTFSDKGDRYTFTKALYNLNRFDGSRSGWFRIDYGLVTIMKDSELGQQITKVLS